MSDHKHNWKSLHEGYSHDQLFGGVKRGDRYKCSECGQTAVMEWVEETTEPAGEWVVHVPNEDTPAAERLRRFAEGTGMKVVEGDPPWREQQFSEQKEAWEAKLKEYAEAHGATIVEADPPFFSFFGSLDGSSFAGQFRLREEHEWLDGAPTLYPPDDFADYHPIDAPTLQAVRSRLPGFRAALDAMGLPKDQARKIATLAEMTFTELDPEDMPEVDDGTVKHEVEG